MRMRSTIVKGMAGAGVAALMLGGALGSVASADDYTKPDAQVSKSNVAAGETIRIRAAGFDPAEVVTIRMVGTAAAVAEVGDHAQEASTVLGTLTADANGVIDGDVKVPAGVKAGNYALQAVRASGAVVELGNITVADQGSQDQPRVGNNPRLPYTGADSGVLLAGGAAALVAGGGAVVVARKRRT